MSQHKEMKNLLKSIGRIDGVEVERRKSGHVHIRRNGRFVYSTSLSPSDHRAVKNVRSALKRSGLVA